MKYEDPSGGFVNIYYKKGNILMVSESGSGYYALQPRTISLYDFLYSLNIPKADIQRLLEEYSE